MHVHCECGGQVTNYHCFYQQRERLGLDDVRHTATLVLLLYGPSGTGKTFTVNAIARHLGKKCLLVNFEMLQSRHSGHFNNADECNSVSLVQEWRLM